jgi:hypothetical protein
MSSRQDNPRKAPVLREVVPRKMTSLFFTPAAVSSQCLGCGKAALAARRNLQPAARIEKASPRYSLQ